MEQLNQTNDLISKRRQRLHELLIALIGNQKDLPLMDAGGPQLENSSTEMLQQDPATWLDRNRRLLKRYQALVRTALTLDALMDAEKDCD